MENTTRQAPTEGQENSAAAPVPAAMDKVSAEFKRPDDTEGGTCD